jgi:RimJ/RimL family protein N-acetyltransferase
VSPVLETERLLLRELRPDDAEAVFDVFDDAYARHWYPHLSEREAVVHRVYVTNRRPTP